MNVVIDGVRYVPAAVPCDAPGLLDYVSSFRDAGGNMAIREYLGALLTKLWEQGEGFSGKRPFGNSGWEYDLYAALIKAGAVEGELDEYDRVQSLHRDQMDKANRIVFGLIAEMCKGAA
jgi:hypothetical protein